jgi:hypothetical protein
MGIFGFVRLRPLPAERHEWPSALGARRGRSEHAPLARGQTLVEFALVSPLFLILLLGTIEFGFMFHATLAVNFASRNASLTAAVAGSSVWSDCKVLEGIENDLAPPLNRALIQNVAIFRTDRAGNPISPPAQNVWTRSGSTVCIGSNGTSFTVPYALGAFPDNTYPPAEVARCDRLSGCQRETSPGVFVDVPLDSIGVRILYRYQFQTPLRNLIAFVPGASAGYLDVSWSNVMRMEPIL